MTIVYAIMAFVAVALFVVYFVVLRQKEPWLSLLFVCVAIVNTGYFLLSASKTLEFAVLANDIAYLGSVFLSMSMFLTIVHLCGFETKKAFVVALSAAGAVMFAITATAGILPWYYKELALVSVDGAVKLEKVYGFLHPVYLIYLVAYFAAMVGCIILSVRMKKIASQRHAALIAAIVFGNIAVWFVEKFIPSDFEFLSVSYLFSEVVLLGLYWVMQEYVRLDLVPRAPATDIATMPMEEKIGKVLSFLSSGEILTAREREILELILENEKRKDIADRMCLSENTIKTYTRTLYGKLGVSSREELYALLVK